MTLFDYIKFDENWSEAVSKINRNLKIIEEQNNVNAKNGSPGFVGLPGKPGYRGEIGETGNADKFFVISAGDFTFNYDGGEAIETKEYYKILNIYLNVITADEYNTLINSEDTEDTKEITKKIDKFKASINGDEKRNVYAILLNSSVIYKLISIEYDDNDRVKLTFRNEGIIVNTSNIGSNIGGAFKVIETANEISDYIRGYIPIKVSNFLSLQNLYVQKGNELTPYNKYSNVEIDGSLPVREVMTEELNENLFAKIYNGTINDYDHKLILTNGFKETENIANSYAPLLLLGNIHEKIGINGSSYKVNDVDKNKAFRSFFGVGIKKYVKSNENNIYDNELMFISRGDFETSNSNNNDISAIGFYVSELRIGGRISNDKLITLSNNDGTLKINNPLEIIGPIKLTKVDDLLLTLNELTISHDSNIYKIGADTQTDSISFYDDNKNTLLYIDRINKQIGINTLMPQASLDVQSSTNQKFRVACNNEDEMVIISGDPNKSNDLYKFGDINSVGNEELFTIDGENQKFTFLNGNVLINTTTDSIYKLNVNGSGYFATGLKIDGTLTLPTTGITGAGSGSGLDADKLDGLHASSFAKETHKNISGINNTGWTNIAYVNGGGLSSAIKFSMSGTTGSVVVNLVADILVEHHTNIYVRSESGGYTQVTLLITSDSNENFYIQVKTTSDNLLTADCRIITYGGEIITWAPTSIDSTYTNTLEHIAYRHQTTISSKGQTSCGLTVKGDTLIQGNIIQENGSSIVSNTIKANSYSYIDYYGSTTFSNPAATLNFYKSRGGSVDIPTIISSTSRIMEIKGYGYDGTNYINAASIKIMMDGTPGTNNMPGKIMFQTTPSGSNTLVDRVTINNDGNVTIGSTASVEKLQIYNNINTNFHAEPTIGLSSDRSDYYSAIGTYRGNGSKYIGLSFFTTNDSALTNRMTIASDGKVGIGTDSPITQTEIKRIETETGNRSAYCDLLTINADATINPYEGFGGGILFKGQTYSNGGGNVNWARIGSRLNDNSANRYGSELFFDVSPLDNGVLNTAMIINYTGNVLINTETDSGYKLDVKGTGHFSEALTIGVYTLPNTDGTINQVLKTNGKGAVSWGTETDPVFTAWNKSTGISITKSQISDFGTYLTNETDPIFTAWNKSTGISILASQISNFNTAITNNVSVADNTAKVSSQWTTRSTTRSTTKSTGSIYYNGNVLINTTTTTSNYNLHISGNVYATDTMTAANFILNSDIRLKENIFRNYITDISNIDLIQFNFKNDKNKRKRYGVIAQELQKTHPEMVYKDGNGYLQVAYIDFLLARINSLEQKINKLIK